MMLDEKDEIALKILKGMHVIAVVGCSRNEGKPSHDVPKYLQDAGYRIIPVNPNADYILGEKAYAKLTDIPFPVDVVDVFRPANEAMQIAKDAVLIGAKAFWLQEGIFNDEAEAYAKEHGLLVISNRCMMKEHYKLILGKY
ncbi:MAG: CoA-binding protein [Candidatus Micrarchaeia archaeon]